jgi:RNA polymerase sigma-70 factor (ECF subfamily)
MEAHSTKAGVPRSGLRGRTGKRAGPARIPVAGREDSVLAWYASRDDPEAFEHLVRRHSALVYRVALRILGPGRAPDASQEVWMTVWRNLKGFRGESAFTTWLYRITTNTCLTDRDRETRRRRRELREGEAPLPPVARGDADPETAALDSEVREELQSALQNVRADHRAALVLRHMEGLSHPEVAEAMQVPIGTAKGWASRGRAAMLVVLTEARSDGPL